MHHKVVVEKCWRKLLAFRETLSEKHGELNSGQILELGMGSWQDHHLNSTTACCTGGFVLILYLLKTCNPSPYGSKGPHL